FINPVITDGDNGIIAGHGRIMAAQKLGIEEVPTVEASHLSEAQKKAYILADNKMALNAGWDDELLALEIADLKDLEFDLSLTGFDPDELADLMQEEITEGLTDEDAVPELPEEPTARRGDVWVLGNHRLMCGDSTMIDDVEKLTEKNSVDLIMTDPPYQIETQGGCKGSIGQGLSK
ncbi:MAG: site-specific DNA-methyltransferase, partial [Gammaproteobacteria bacterium]|nr:site-specific DNA-methyltransferase [Gammaproteobacteria bacterium]